MSRFDGNRIMTKLIIFNIIFRFYIFVTLNWKISMCLHSSTFCIHVRYTQTESIRLMNSTIWLNLHGIDPWNDTRTFLVLTSSFLKRENKLQSIRMRHFTTRLDWHGVASRAKQLLAWQINNRGSDLCPFDRVESNQQHFQPTLHIPGVLCGSTSGMINRQQGKEFMLIW